MKKFGKEKFQNIVTKFETKYKQYSQIILRILLLAGVANAVYIGHYLHNNDYSPGRPPSETINSSPLYDGVVYSRIIGQFPRPLVIHILEVEVSKVSFLVTPMNTNIQGEQLATTTSAFLKEFGLQIAINANFFTPFSAHFPFVGVYPQIGDQVDIQGQAISMGQEYSQPQQSFPVLCLSTNSAAINESSCDAETQNAIAGNRLLVDDGIIGTNLNTKDQHPRMGAGVSADGKILYLVAIDGRQFGYSEGVTEQEFALFVASELELQKFINLDGGGSTTMVDQQLGFINSPIQTNIQGLPRPVANHLGIWAQELER